MAEGEWAKRQGHCSAFFGISKKLAREGKNGKRKGSSLA